MAATVRHLPGPEQRAVVDALSLIQNTYTMVKRGERKSRYELSVKGYYIQ